MSEVEIRKIHKDEIADCIELQTRTWGDSVVESILVILNRIGGLVAGAFIDGHMVGTLIGMPGEYKGEAIQWSCRLAVDPVYQNRHIGYQLKCYQQAECKKAGIPATYWTFDPLLSKNAHFNFNRLGADFVGIEANVYPGVHHLNLGPSDRLIVRWDSNAGHRSKHDQALIRRRAMTFPAFEKWTAKMPPAFRMAIPDDVVSVSQNDPDRVKTLRKNSTELFTHAFDAGYQILGLYRDAEVKECYYYFEI